MRRLAWPVLAVGLSGALAACGPGAATHVAAGSATLSASAVKTYSPLSGPVESAAQLPKTCSGILTEADLTTVFGMAQSGDNDYASYAPLPTIGRTGRVTCGFGIGLDSMGNATPPVATVSVITYDLASTALTRIGTTESASGVAPQSVLVDGHPAAIIAEPTATDTTAGASPTGSAAPMSSAAGVTATASTATGGDTELLMADGNRTFVIDLPQSTATGTAANQELVALAALVYQHTLA